MRASQLSWDTSRVGIWKRLKGAVVEATFNVKGAGTLGSMSIPGKAELELPAGRVRVTYEQTGRMVRGSESADPTFGGMTKGPQMPRMSVRPRAGGEPLEFERFGGVNTGHVGEDKIRALVGSLVVPEPDAYVIDAPEPFNDPAIEANFTPLIIGTDTKLLFDPG